MATNLDPKAFIRTSFTNADQLVRTPRGLEAPNLGPQNFAQTFQSVQQVGRVNTSSFLNPSVPSVSVQSGDTLAGIVKNYMAANGQPVSYSDALRLSQDVAKTNGIANANLIYPGQRIQLSALITHKENVATIPATNTINPSILNNSSKTLTTATSALQGLGSFIGGTNTLLNKTLDRAVEKGFIPAQDRQAVYDKILGMAQNFKFAPDDFARLTLMESDGMNPKASNNRCHGIIQFCDGPDRGAASAGFANNPKAILNHSVLQQLDMVSKYFEQTGLRNQGPFAGLDDLYLTVLTPAARSETRPHVGLNIAGTQSPYLHVNRDRKSPITRESIVQGLHQNANDRLKIDSSSTEPSATNNRAQSLRVSAYLNANYIR